MEQEPTSSPGGQPFADCFARSCRHLADGRCEVYTASHPPTITVDGRCLGHDSGTSGA